MSDIQSWSTPESIGALGYESYWASTEITNPNGYPFIQIDLYCDQHAYVYLLPANEDGSYAGLQTVFPIFDLQTTNTLAHSIFHMSDNGNRIAVPPGSFKIVVKNRDVYPNDFDSGSTISYRLYSMSV